MARGLEIHLVEQRSPGARAAIPSTAIGRVATMIRDEQSIDPESDTRTDEELVADMIISELRERVRRYEYHALLRAAEESVQSPDVEF